MLELRDIRKSYGSLVAVDGVSLNVAKGEIVGLLGPNGAGKSTTIGIAVGLLAPDSGDISVAGEGSPTQPRTRRHIGLAPQAIALYEELRADETLLLFARVAGLNSADAKAAVDRELARVGLADRRKGRVKTFSGGMKRRLNFAAALLHDPALILLDEPTAGVDPQSRAAILDLVLALKREGRAVLYTTHYMEEAQRICDRVLIMDKGRIMAEGSVRELIDKHGGPPSLTVTTAAGEERSDVADPLAALQTCMKRSDVLNVRIDRPDLEAVFLHLTGRKLRD